MKFRAVVGRFCAILVTVIAVTLAPCGVGVAIADDGSDAQTFVEKQRTQIESALKAHATSAQVYNLLEKFVDYDELVRRSFGHPCPTAVPGCTDHWSQLSDAEKTEIASLLKQLVQKNYRKSLNKTLDYEVTYKDVRVGSLGDIRVRTEAKSKTKPRDPSVQVDYMVRCAGGSCKVTDMVTEGSFLTKNYYDQFHKAFMTPDQLYPYIREKLQKKIAKPD